MQRSNTALRSMALVACLCLLAPACASVSIDRSTKTSGTYRSTGWALTLLSIDMPQSALKIARENTADFRLANTIEQSARVSPDIGWLNWIFNIVGVRKATVKGTWGFEDR